MSQYTRLTDGRTDGQNLDGNTVRMLRSRTVKMSLAAVGLQQYLALNSDLWRIDFDRYVDRRQYSTPQLGLCPIESVELSNIKQFISNTL